MEKNVLGNTVEWYWKDWTLYKMKRTNKRCYGFALRSDELAIDLGKWSFGMWK